MHTVEVEVIQGLTFEDMRKQAERVRLRRLPPRTLQHWLSRLKIRRDPNGRYDASDLEVVKALIRHLRNPENTIDDFVNQLIQGI